MSSSTIDWDQILWSMMYAAPQLLAYLVAIIFCFIRRRENPKGAVYLGLAVMISLISTAFSYGWPFLFSITGSSSLYGSLQYILVGFHAVTSISIWGLIIAAVFARPTHYDYRGGSAFNDE